MRLMQAKSTTRQLFRFTPPVMIVEHLMPLACVKIVVCISCHDASNQSIEFKTGERSCRIVVRRSVIRQASIPNEQVLRRGFAQVEATAWEAGKLAEAKPGTGAEKQAERLFTISRQARQAINRLDAQLPPSTPLERERVLVKAQALLADMRAHLPK